MMLEEDYERRNFCGSPVETPFGNAYVLCMDNGRFLLTSSNPRKCHTDCLLNFGVLYQIVVHLFDYGNGLEIVDGKVFSSIDGSMGTGEMSEDARKEFVAWLIPFMQQWVKDHPSEEEIIHFHRRVDANE